jgi:hypothetical protein
VATKEYMVGRRKYLRPQGLILANNPGYVVDGARIPEGNEFEDFIILSDDNRGPINIVPQRIENKLRTVNGRMRSYYIADKAVISTSWARLPSRAYNVEPEFSNFGETSGKITNLVDFVEIEGDERPVKSFGSPYFNDQQYTSDGGAGGVEILEWHKNNPGSFWVFLAYDNYKNMTDDFDGTELIRTKYQKLGNYSDVVEVFFQNFDYNIETRGSNNFDLWSINLALEEV